MLRMFDSEGGLVKWSEWVIAEWVFAAGGQMMGPLTICRVQARNYLRKIDVIGWNVEKARLDPISL